jgi:ATP-dependent DNA ligase
MSTKIAMPCLYKRSATGKTLVWLISVEKTSKGFGRIKIEHGEEGGKLQEKIEIISKGKNEGRKNATTPYDQAVLEVEARWKKQLNRKGYGETVEQSATTRAASPMLALVFEKVKEIDWSTAFAQPKLNGFRCLARKEKGKIILLSRENQLIKTLPHLEAELLSAMEDGQSFDGELYGHGLSLAKIASLVKRHQDENVQIKYNLYDVMADVPYAERSKLLRSRVGGEFDHLKLVETVKVRTKDELITYQKHCIENGFEGAMLRHTKAGYDAGKRSKFLLKVKTFKDAEFKVIDAKEGRGTYAGAAIFMCETADGHEFEVTAPGDMEQKRAYWRDHQKWLGKQLTVKFSEWTSGEEPVPFHPVAIEFKTTL